ncbi:hypothetical protein BH11VER1_BH11VER1_04260 [soil metagenome]
MRKSFENYTRLTGTHGRRGSLWKGEDHLLAVEGNGILYPYSEQYRRVDYKNIQAISYVLTKRYWLVLCALLIPILGLAGGAALAFSAEKIPLAITLSVILLPFLAILIVHMVMGKTCVCTLQTAVQNLRLRPLTRINKARQVMSEIESLCLLHQAAMPTEFTDAPTPQKEVELPGTKPMWRGSAWVTTAGIALVIMAATLVVFGATLLSGLTSRSYSLGVLYLEAFAGMTALGCSIAGLTKAMKTQTPDGLMATLWTSLGLEVLGGGAIYLLVVFQSMADSESSDPSRQVFARLMSLGELTLEQMQVAGWIIIGLGCVFALPGLILMYYGFRKAALEPKPTASTTATPGP